LVKIFSLRFFEFTGTIHSVTFDVNGEVIRDSKAALRMILARQ
jgi:hypothetical protein